MLFRWSIYVHERSTGSFVVWWLSHGLFKRFLIALPVTFFSSISFIGFAIAVDSKDLLPFRVLFSVAALLVWFIVPSDAWYQHRCDETAA